MYGHHLHMPFGEGLVRIFILIHAALVEQLQKAVEEVPTEGLTVAVSDHRVVVIVLEGVEELGKEREVASAVLIAGVAPERLVGEQTEKVVGWPQVE